MRFRPVGESTTSAWDLPVTARVWVGGHNLAAKLEIERRLVATVRPPTGPLDAGFVAPISTDEAVYFAEKLRSRLVPTGVIWIAYADPTSTRNPAMGVELDDLTRQLVALGFSAGGRSRLGDQHTAISFRPPHDHGAAHAPV
jgi:hypothetical protein